MATRPPIPIGMPMHITVPKPIGMPTPTSTLMPTGMPVPNNCHLVVPWRGHPISENSCHIPAIRHTVCQHLTVTCLPQHSSSPPLALCWHIPCRRGSRGSTGRLGYGDGCLPLPTSPAHFRASEPSVDSAVLFCITALKNPWREQ